MNTTALPLTTSKGMLWAGRILTALVTLFLVFDCSVKLIKSLFPVFIGVLAWAGIYFRDPQLRALIPLRK